MKYARLAFVFLLSVSSSFAAPSAERVREISSRADLYFSKIGTEFLSIVQDQCLPMPLPGDCAAYVAGNYSSTDERIQAARACVGNYGSACARFVAGPYSTVSERIEGAKACRNNQTTECVKFVSGAYASVGERTTSAAACANADIKCVRYVAGSYASLGERIAAAKSCSGQE